MQLLDGKTLGQKIIDGLKTRDLSRCSLHVILVGDDPSSLKYVALKRKKAAELGISFTLHHQDVSTTTVQLLDLVGRLNTDSKVTGFFIQLPLPSNVDKNMILSLISPQKDVDGLNPASTFIPATVLGIITLLENYNLDFTDKPVVIINDSALIGQPLKKHFPQAVLCNDKTTDIRSITKTADLLISATGVKNLITADMVKPGAVVVDVAGGDVNFAEVSPKCSYITPTYGGVGPMTIASLLSNLVKINKI